MLTPRYGGRSGRFINAWNWLTLFTEEKTHQTTEKMKFGFAPSASA